MTAPSMLLGTLRTLTVLKRIPAGLLLDGEDLGDVLLPARELADDAADVEALEVFLYEDGDGRPPHSPPSASAPIGTSLLARATITLRRVRSYRCHPTL